MGTGEFNAGGNPAMDWHPIQGGVEIFLVASCHGNRDKLRPDGPLGWYADFTYLIGLITVSDAILTGRQSGQKLQCLYGNPMANNFFQNRITNCESQC